MSTIIHSVPAEARTAHWPLSQRQRACSEPARGLAAQIRRDLGAAGYPALRRIDVTLDYCGVLLRGTVPTYFVKQLAQELAMRAAGKDPVWNEIEVEKEGDDARATSHR